MGRPKSIINPGQRFKDWLVIKETDKKNGFRYFLCECLRCNNEYQVTLSSLTNENACFCCRPCSQSKRYEKKADGLIGKVFGRLTVISKHSVTKSGQWQYNCECTCGNEKVIRGTTLTSGNTTSCGCYFKEQARERMSGENNHSWKGGITPQSELDRGKIQKEVAFIIRIRDNHTCQNCGQYKGYINVHHIFDFSNYPELRFEERNLITLCKTCHDDFHKIYDKRSSNTLGDLESWMGEEYKYHNELLEIYNEYYTT